MALLKQRFRPMGFNDILDEAFDLYKNNFVLLVGIALFVYFPIGVLGKIWMGSMQSSLAGTNPAAEPSEYMGNLFGVLIPLVVLSTLGYCIATAATCFAVSRRYLDEPTSIGGAYGAVIRRSGALLLTWLLAGIVIGVPFLLVCFVAGLMGALGGGIGAGAVMTLIMLLGFVVLVAFMVKFAFVTAAFVIERVSYRAALERSWRLVAGHGWRIFGIIFVTWLVMIIVTKILNWPFDQIVARVLPGNVTGGLALSGVAAGLIDACLTPIWSLVLVLLYYDVRIRKEGFDLEILAKNLAEQTPVTQES